MSIPYVPQGTTKRFRVPRTLAADFDAFLNQDIPDTNMDFELLHCWYDKFEQDYVPTYVRGEIYPDSTKSRYENTDNNMNLRCSRTSGIRKGDMVIESDGTIYVLDWEVHLQSNNAPTRALRCNMMLKVTRHKTTVEPDEQTIVGEDGVLIDEDGFVIEQPQQEETSYLADQTITIVSDIPCNAYRYDGRPEYTAVSGTPGADPNALTIMTVQYNDQTKNIHIDDEFEWGNETYFIVDVNRVGININGEYGVLKLQAKKKPGGLHGY